jgi:hypothetical protein
MFKRTKRRKAPVRMTRVCETCYGDADMVDRILMVMVADWECEYCKEELEF